MGTLISAFNISSEALSADQSALNTTSNNVANENTIGYTREVANFATNDLVTLNGNGETTDGVEALAPTSVRDRVLDQRVEQQTQVQSQSQSLQTALSDLENVFGLSSGQDSSNVTSLGTSLDSFFGSFTALASNPSQPATRQQVLSAAGSLASVLNSTSSQIGQISNDLSQQALAITGNANQLVTTIAGLNAQILSASPNSDAGALEDQRQAAITQLSQYVGLTQIRTSQNGIELTTVNGGLLVAGSNAYALTASVTPIGVQISGGLGDVNLTNGLTGGSLGGTLAAISNNLPAIQTSLDTLAYSVATAVNTQNEAGLDANGNAGQALFTIGTSAPGSALSIAVAVTDPNLVAAAGPGEGSSGSTNATALADLANANIVAGSTATNYLAAALAQVGTSAAAANSDLTVQQATLTQLTTQQNQLQGVSLDEEAANLTQYQRSYQAASSLFAIINTLLASAINLGVETAVS
jgi:flagellar hook-associated protein 1 FlgK